MQNPVFVHGELTYEVDQRGKRFRRSLLIVDGKVLIEIKSIERLLPVHEAQVLTYLRLSGLRVGLLINFNVTSLKAGIRRFVK